MGGAKFSEATLLCGQVVKSGLPAIGTPGGAGMQREKTEKVV